MEEDDDFYYDSEEGVDGDVDDGFATLLNEQIQGDRNWFGETARSGMPDLVQPPSRATAFQFFLVVFLNIRAAIYFAATHGTRFPNFSTEGVKSTWSSDCIVGVALALSQGNAAEAAKLAPDIAKLRGIDSSGVPLAAEVQRRLPTEIVYNYLFKTGTLAEFFEFMIESYDAANERANPAWGLLCALMEEHPIELLRGVCE